MRDAWLFLSLRVGSYNLKVETVGVKWKKDSSLHAELQGVPWLGQRTGGDCAYSYSSQNNLGRAVSVWITVRLKSKIQRFRKFLFMCTTGNEKVLPDRSR